MMSKSFKLERSRKHNFISARAHLIKRWTELKIIVLWPDQNITLLEKLADTAPSGLKWTGVLWFLVHKLKCRTCDGDLQ